MSNWTSFNLKEIPALDGLAAGARAVVTPAKMSLQALSGLASGASAFLVLYTDLANMQIIAPLAAAKASLSQLQEMINGGAYTYIDPGSIFSDAAPDGISGFLNRWENSFYDVSDFERPVFSGDSHLTALLIAAGGDNPDVLDDLLIALADLLKKPSLKIHRRAKTERQLELLEHTLPSPPDWRNIKLGKFITPLGTVANALDDVIDAMDVAFTMKVMAEEIATLAAKKAEALETMVTKLETAVAIIKSLVETSGLYALRVDSETGVKGIISAAREADGPPWNSNAFVAGLCLLSPTADFGPIATILGA